MREPASPVASAPGEPHPGVRSLPDEAIRPLMRSGLPHYIGSSFSAPRAGFNSTTIGTTSTDPPASSTASRIRSADSYPRSGAAGN
jgi:hypothetical protein